MIRFSAQLRQAVSWLGQKRLALEGGKQALTGPGVPSALRWLCPLCPLCAAAGAGPGPSWGPGVSSAPPLPQPSKKNS